MGLSASQVRYLSLTARQSDLEYQAQVINSQRLALASESSAASRAYTQGMSNKIIRISHYENNAAGNSTKIWNEITYSNIIDQAYQIVGSNGELIAPSPYKEYNRGTEFTYEEYMALPASERGKCVMDGTQTYNVNETFVAYTAGATVSKEIFDLYPDLCVEQEGHDGQKTYIVGENDISFAEGSSLSNAQYLLLPSAERLKCACNNDCKFIAMSHLRVADPNYVGIDIQSLLVSGQAQLVTNSFFQFLCDHGYKSGRLVDDNNQETTYAKLVEMFQTDTDTMHDGTIVDWRADATSTFKEDFYTEDDPQVTADYESKTADIQQKDKMLEVQLKQIETQHKAIETEMEAVKKVIEKNIENTYKTFG